jgi:3-dehydroquinate synthase
MQAKALHFQAAAPRFILMRGFRIWSTSYRGKTALFTDATVFAAHAATFTGWKTIVIKAGEAYKEGKTVEEIITQLIEHGADRTTTLIGVGGGVVTDITGYVASIYLRGIPFGFVPTTVLAMVDAAIGGKNGIDVGVYKNMVGTINQPKFLLYDMDFLKSLPRKEWCNGFAEIIKHAAIKDKVMFEELEAASLEQYQQDATALQSLIQRNAMLKGAVVQEDEFEKGPRRLLNFGHTLAHALEKKYSLMHGEAVAIGMVFAAKLSAARCGFEKVDRLRSVIESYGLPTNIPYEREAVFDILKRDKKKEGSDIHYILLNEIGNASVQKISLTSLNQYL